MGNANRCDSKYADGPGDKGTTESLLYDVQVAGIYCKSVRLICKESDRFACTLCNREMGLDPALVQRILDLLSQCQIIQGVLPYGSKIYYVKCTI